MYKSALNVVILEDNFFIREALKRLIGECSSWNDQNIKINVDVFSSSNGVEGLGYIFVSDPDIILVDITLPKYSGREVLDYILTNASFHPNGRKVVILTDGQKKLDLPEGYVALNKRSESFVSDFVGVISQHSKSSSIKLNLQKKTNFWQKFRRGAISKIINQANKTDLLFEKIKAKRGWGLLLFIPRYFVWLVRQLICTIYLTILNLVTKKVEDANIKQKEDDYTELRVRYYPTLVTFFTGFVVVLIQVILLMTGGLTVYLWGDQNIRLTSVLANRSNEVDVSFNNAEYDSSLVEVSSEEIKLKPQIISMDSNEYSVEPMNDVESIKGVSTDPESPNNPDSYPAEESSSPASGEVPGQSPEESSEDTAEKVNDSNLDEFIDDSNDPDNVIINPESTSYPTDKPSITITNPVSYSSVKSIIEISNLNTKETSLDLDYQPNSKKFNITYQLSPDGENWYYYEDDLSKPIIAAENQVNVDTNNSEINRLWDKTSKGWESSNTVQEVNKYLVYFDQQFSTGEIYIKIFLHSLSGEYSPVITDIFIERELELVTNVTQSLPQESQIQRLTISGINVDDLQPEIYSAAYVDNKKIIKGKLLTKNKSLIVTYDLTQEELDKYEARIYFSNETEATKEELIGTTDLYINKRGELEFLLTADSEPGGYITAQIVKKEDSQTSTSLAEPAKNDSFSVDSTLDTADAAIDGVCDDGSGNCTFRAAITEANQTHASEPDVIDFKIPVSDPGYLDYSTAGAGDGVGADDYWSIKPTTELPAISEGATIDGESQATFIGVDSNNNGPEIEIDGENLSGVDLITVTGSNTTINHLVVNNSTDSGIYVYASDFTLTKSYIGTDVTSYTAKPNNRGVYTNGWHVNNVTIGNDVTDGNVISGNSNYGVYTDCNGNDSLPPRTITVRGNIFGLSHDGEQRITTIAESMRMIADCDLEVGGPDESYRNIFSGSPYRSLALVTPTSNFTTNVENNFFGTGLTGTESRSSSGVIGIFIHSWTSAVDAAHPPIEIQNNLFKHLWMGVAASDGFKYIIEENSFGDNTYGVRGDGFWTGSNMHYRTPMSIHNNYFGETNSDPYFGLSMGANDVAIKSFGPMDIKGNQIIKNNSGIEGAIRVTSSATDGNLFSYPDIGGGGAFIGSLCNGLEENCIKDNDLSGIRFVSALPSNEASLYSDNDFGNGNGPENNVNIQQEWFGLFELFSGNQRRTDLSRSDLNINFPEDKIITYTASSSSVSGVGGVVNPTIGINQSVTCQSAAVCPTSGHTNGTEGETSVIVPVKTYDGYDKEFEFKFGYPNYKNYNDAGIIYNWYRITEYIIDNSGTKHDYGLWKVDDYHLVSNEFSFDGDATTHPVSTSTERIIENEYFDPSGSTTVNDSYYDRGEPWTNHPNAVRDVSSLDYSNFQVMELEVVDANPIQQADGSYVITVDSVTNEDNVSLNFVDDGAGVASGGGYLGPDGISNAKTSLKEAVIVANNFPEPVTIKFADNVKNYVPTEAVVFDGGENTYPDIIDGEGVIFDGINISDAPCIDFNNQSNITIKGLAFRNCEQEAIRVTDGGSNKFESVITGQSSSIFNPDFDQSYSGWFINETTSISSVTPDAIDGLVMWLDAEQGITTDTGVSVWADQSGSGNDATQTTGTEQPTQVAGVLNGKPVIRFDGTDDWMSFPEISDIRSVFWVIKEDPSATATYRSLLGHSTDANFHRGFEKALFFTSYYGTSVHVENGETFIRGEEVHPYWARIDSNKVPTEHAIISLITTGDVAADQLTRDRNYANRGWWGDIAEVLIFNEPLSKKDQRSIEKYLSEKYTLPTTYVRPQVQYQTHEVYKGDGAVRVTTDATKGKFTQKSALQPDKNYFLTIYVKNSSGLPVNSNTIQLYLGSTVIPTQYTLQENGWYKITGQAMVSQGEREFGVLLSEGQDIYLDEFSIGSTSQYTGISSSNTPINLIGNAGSEKEYRVTINDEGDLDSGPNSLQNSAIITKVTYLGDAKYLLEGDLSGNSSEGPFNLEVFKSDNHVSGHGGSVSSIGSIEINDSWKVIVEIPGSDGYDGQVFTTLVTNSNNSTSEFGENFVADESNANYIIDRGAVDQNNSDIEVIRDDSQVESPESYSNDADLELTTGSFESYPDSGNQSQTGLFKIPGVVLSTLVPLFMSILMASAVSFLLLMQSSNVISGIRHIGILLGIVIPRKKKYWGIVFDVEKSKGIPFAIVRLKREVEENSVTRLKLATQTFTDEKGRYGMVVETPGEYIIEVLANGFERVERSIKFDDLSMKKEIVEDFPMVKVGEKLSWFNKLRFYNKDRIIKLFKLALLVLMILGFIYTVLVTLISPHILNYIMLAIYGLLFILNILVLARLRTKTIGKVKDEVTGDGLGGVSFRVYKNEKQVDLTLTNTQGELKLNIKEGSYKAILNKRGYIGAVIKNNENRKETSPVVDVKIKKSGHLKEDIVMRKRADEKIFTKSDTLASPFS